MPRREMGADGLEGDMLIGSSAKNLRDFGREMGWGEGIGWVGFVWLKKRVLGEGENAFLKTLEGFGVDLLRFRWVCFWRHSRGRAGGRKKVTLGIVNSDAIMSCKSGRAKSG